MSIRPNYIELDATKTPTALDIAWAAGIYEGEGSVRLCGRGKRSLAAQVVQKDPELLYRLRDWFGGSVCGPNTNEVHVWNICGDRCRIFLALTYSYFTARRRNQVDVTGAFEFLQGLNPEDLSVEFLKSKLIGFNEALMSTNPRSIQRRKEYARKPQEPNRSARMAAQSLARKEQPAVESNVVKIDRTA